ncbi:hypothetical protein VTK56DRAFT_4198 [Thermocarpiscus australiensis]
MTHDRTSSAGTEISQLSDAMRNESSAYQPPDAGVEAYHVEYQAIPWDNHGSGKTRLSIRSALFYLAMMAAFGGRSMMPTYPAFDSWWFRDDAGMFVHNTTGMVAKKKPKVLEHPEPCGERRPEWVTFTSEDGESEDFLTRASSSFSRFYSPLPLLGKVPFHIHPLVVLLSPPSSAVRGNEVTEIDEDALAAPILLPKGRQNNSGQMEKVELLLDDANVQLLLRNEHVHYRKARLALV